MKKKWRSQSLKSCWIFLLSSYQGDEIEPAACPFPNKDSTKISKKDYLENEYEDGIFAQQYVLGKK